MARMPALLTIDEALERVLERVVPLEAEDVPVERAAGRVLAEAARATVDLPPFASSAMDGFAVRSADTPGTMRVVARAAAGRPAGRTVGAREAIEISTGGVVPEGADAVIPVEYVVARDNEIVAETPVAAGANVRPRGGDTRRGDVVVPAGARLGPAQLGALAAAGLAAAACQARCQQGR